MVSNRHDKIVLHRGHQEGGQISLLCAAKMTPLLIQPSFTIIGRVSLPLIFLNCFYCAVRTLLINFSRTPYGVSKAKR